MVTADQSSELISLLCRLSRVEPALRTNGRQVRNSVPLRVEAKGPGLTLDWCHRAVNCVASSFRESRSFVRRWCRNGGSGDDDDETIDDSRFYCPRCFKLCGNHIFVNDDNKEVKWKNVFLILW